MHTGLTIFLTLCVLALPVAPHAQSPEPSPDASSAPVNMATAPDRILVVGGTRGTGLEIVRLLRARGQHVTVMARQSSDTAALEPLEVPVVRADAVDAAQVQAAIAPGRFRAVISTLGARRREKKPPDFEGNRHVIDAARAAGVHRFLMISTIGAGDSSDTASLAAKLLYGEVMTLKTQAEEYLGASGLDYTIIRPGGLLDKPPSGKAVLSEDPGTFSWIARADLAQLVADALDDQTTIGKTYSAYDETRERFWARWRE